MKRRFLLLAGILILVVLVFGTIADRAIVKQRRGAEKAAWTEAEETARLAALSVRAALARHELAAVANRPLPSATTYRLVLSSRQSLRSESSRPYSERPTGELINLVRDSIAITPQGLPEAVVAAFALDTREAKSEAADRLLSGQLPVHPDDLGFLARSLEIDDDQLASLKERLRTAPGTESLPLVPVFHRSLSTEEAVQGWTRTADLGLGYEIPIRSLLSEAQVPERVQARVSQLDSVTSGRSATSSVPDLPGLLLEVSAELPGRETVITSRAILWAAVLASILALATAIRGLRREAMAVSREKAFLSGVTHELRTPLASIRLFGETLSEGRGDPQEYGSLVAQESERLETLVERVLAVTRTDEAPRFARVSPAEIIDSVVQLMATRAKRGEVTIDWPPREQMAPLPEATWDGDAVQQALMNLVDNAIKHGKQGGIVTLRADDAGDSLKLSVSDDGPGIAPRDRRRIFGRFERSDSESAGTGLGLYLVEQVALAHGGRVDLNTADDRGSTFTLVLPILPPASNGEAMTEQPT